MFKLQNQLKIISICLLFFLGILLINNKKSYASPGIDLNVRRNQLEEEKNSLIIELNNVFNDMNLDSQTRLNRMIIISNRINIVLNNLQMINQQIIARNERNLQNQNNPNQPNNNRRY